jgi:hypothetical protein
LIDLPIFMRGDGGLTTFPPHLQAAAAEKAGAAADA